MITESDTYRRDERVALVYSLFGSLLVNALVWLLSLWLIGLRLHFVLHQPKVTEFYASSSSITLEHRIVPRPPQPVAQGAPSQSHTPVRTVAAAPRPELTAPPRPQASPPVQQATRHDTLAQQLAQQQQAFEKETQQMRESRSPLSNTKPSDFKPSSYQRDYLDLNGGSRQERVQALLYPDHHFTSGGLTCYDNVYYYAQFSGGGTEQGPIPWPICYPVGHDAMLPLNRPHLLPIPYPPAGWKLPADATLGPMLLSIYNHTIHS